MYPHLDELSGMSSGIAQVVKYYFKHLPELGIELVDPLAESYDLDVGHAAARPGAMVHHSHGLLWTGDKKYGDSSYNTNRDLVAAIRYAKEVTVPSAWVAETFQRDMRFYPHIVWHGVDWDDWQHSQPNEGYVLWGKNRTSDWLDPGAINSIAAAFPNITFVTTFGSKKAPPNVKNLGNHAIPHKDMKVLIQSAAVVLATDKETWGIMPAEAMAAGTPVLSIDLGGVPDFMEHGVSGYCYQPGNLEDAIQGLSYCLEHRDGLGRNAREAARSLTWEAACHNVAHIYEDALKDKEPSVAVVIPTYNYGHVLGEAIASAVHQDYPLVTDIVIVDDGSTDKVTESVLHEWMQKDKRVRWMEQDNQGVAIARNQGYQMTDTKYVVFLDADDKIEPKFISSLVPELEGNRSLGIAYTGVRVPLPDGQEAMPHDWPIILGPKQFLSKNPWPRKYSFDDQIERANQVPTCCLVRRKALDRVGGYRARYCPLGAGSEDAEMFTRIGAYGWGAKYIEPKRDALFVHTHGSGYVSGNYGYQEADWLSWHPWVEDGAHPFASVATPAHISHEVRSYDQPMVSVIIPVGPGHEEILLNALDSLESQFMRKWEAIVVLDGISMTDMIDTIQAYPYVKWIETAGIGAGAARNYGVSKARAPFIAFLDADDYYHPFFLNEAIAAYTETGAAIYTDFVSILGKDQKEEYGAKEVVGTKNGGNKVLVADRFADFDMDRALKRPEGERPYVWSGVTIFLPKTWHDQIGGFDEGMDSWEDCDYLLRLAWSGKNFYRVEKELWIYDFTSGKRRASQTGTEPELMTHMQGKYDEQFRVLRGQ
jgi:glycosyltransferase involved in cell wall biosynthesis